VAHRAGLDAVSKGEIPSPRQDSNLDHPARSREQIEIGDFQWSYISFCDGVHPIKIERTSNNQFSARFPEILIYYSSSINLKLYQVSRHYIYIYIYIKIYYMYMSVE
jgi:hypothetical protein